MAAQEAVQPAAQRATQRGELAKRLSNTNLRVLFSKAGNRTIRRIRLKHLAVNTPHKFDLLTKISKHKIIAPWKFDDSGPHCVRVTSHPKGPKQDLVIDLT